LLDRFTGNADGKAGLISDVPFKRAGKPEEIADTIVYFTSDKAAFVSGQISGINGGKTAARPLHEPREVDIRHRSGIRPSVAGRSAGRRGLQGCTGEKQMARRRGPASV
jgi:hypothetical protein